MHLPSFIISHLPQRWGGATRGKPYGLLWMAVYDIHRHDVSTICE